MTAQRLFPQAADMLAVFLASGGTLVLEIAAAHLLAPHTGLTLHVWTGVIAAVMPARTAGHWFGGRLASGDARTARRRVANALAAAALSGLATLALVPWLANAMPDGRSPLTIAVLSLPFLPPALFAGLVAPILTTLAIEQAKHGMGRAFGRLYATSAVGGVVGAMATGYVLLGWLGLTDIVTGVAACFGLVAVIMALAAPRKTDARRAA
jgi:predicted membrane-bound spermidine synthase